VLPGSGGPRNLTAVVENRGAIDVATDVTIGKAGAPVSLLNAGHLRVASAALLSVIGGFTQDPAGELDVALGGTAAGGYSRVVATGAATLGGTLAVSRVGDFSPNTGNTFRVVA